MQSLKSLMSVRSLTLVFLCTVFSITTAAAPVPDSLFMQGNAYYMQRQYSMAEECYTTILKQGYTSADLYFNLGNALYKQDKIAASILYYEKALVLKPGDEDIKENLSLANARILDKIDAIPKFFLKRWVNDLQGLFSPDTWAIICIALFGMALAGFLVYYVSSPAGVKRVAFTLSMVLFFLFVISGVLMATRIGDILRHDEAIIMSSSVTARSSPDEQSTNVFVLHEGTKVSITDSIQDWKEIRIADGNTGWVPVTVLEEI